jgi:hypothetical protein
VLSVLLLLLHQDSQPAAVLQHQHQLQCFVLAVAGQALALVAVVAVAVAVAASDSAAWAPCCCAWDSACLSHTVSHCHEHFAPS